MGDPTFSISPLILFGIVALIWAIGIYLAYKKAKKPKDKEDFFYYGDNEHHKSDKI